MFPPHIQHQIKSIQSDNTKGAVELTTQVAAILARVDSEVLEPTAQALVAAQPSMAPIFNLCNVVLHVSKKNRQTIIDDYLTKLQNAGEQISAIANAHIEYGNTIMTHSYSSTVRDALLVAEADGKKLTIICTESRPMNEGTLLAQQLAEANIQVQLIVDAAMQYHLSEVDLVLFGADTIYPGGILNKIGSSMLALAASAANVPVYSLASSHKFLPFAPPAEQEHNPDEITTGLPANVKISNFYFDTTAFEHISGIITEDDLLHSGDDLFDHIDIHPAIKKPGI